MPSLTGTLRRFALAPSPAHVSFAGRGFPAAGSPAGRRLEAIPQAVVCGFEWAVDGLRQSEVVSRLELVDAEHRGFAYEGATMAYTVRDAMAAGRGTRARELLRGPAVPHTFLTYIGIGFAMARLPRALWRNVLPDLDGTPYYPTMSWLAVDGYGFDLAYFHTERYVTRQVRPAPYPWLGRPGYFRRAADQGIGRALWFIHGGSPAGVSAAVAAFAADRRADLWSGVGLAATFAGGCDVPGLRSLLVDAGTDAAHLGQGAVFAAKARSYSGFVPEHTEAGVQALAGVDVRAAAALADDVAVSGFAGEDEVDYEVWRGRVRHRLAPLEPGVQR
ncbi:MAG: DUF1702 family protein [Actinomycetota bacterium]|nr:DUF1702 family protein [Actinomycetota bacterium]